MKKRKTIFVILGVLLFLTTSYGLFLFAQPIKYKIASYSKNHNQIYYDLIEIVGTSKFIDSDNISIPRTGKAIFANLQEMQLVLYENGREVETLPIASIGKTGQPWETPKGQFSVLTKEKNHFSSVTGVWMPYSMQFLGNYFIHGWPYYENMTPVSLGFSGGCIRLQTVNAEKVFAFADRGIPLLVSGNNVPVKKTVIYKVKEPMILPKVTAESYLIADLDSGAVIAKKNSNQTYPIASLTKLLTALVALDQINPISSVTVGPDQRVIPYRQVGSLAEGETFIARDLISPLLLESSNKAAEVLAMRVGEKRFVSEMNKRARGLGLKQSNFSDPAGINADNTSSVEDLFLLTRHLFFEKSYIFYLTRQKEINVNGHQWVNVNPFVQEVNFLGGKSGQTDIALQSFINLFRINLGTEERRIAIILLRSTDRDQDTRVLLDYLKTNIHI